MLRVTRYKGLINSSLIFKMMLQLTKSLNLTVSRLYSSNAPTKRQQWGSPFSNLPLPCRRTTFTAMLILFCSSSFILPIVLSRKQLISSFMEFKIKVSPSCVICIKPFVDEPF
ncbi:uncharacterized protein LOC131950189 [Physella acuta]|uniref:uncharacterized protein LOC131950189 n=1 Tax=Physella acuta TaxID=109671 RepID=UPI0027DC027B|nr:uncharacterized protein LOC131950189 [Physella acuta]